MVQPDTNFWVVIAPALSAVLIATGALITAISNRITISNRIRENENKITDTQNKAVEAKAIATSNTERIAHTEIKAVEAKAIAAGIGERVANLENGGGDRKIEGVLAKNGLIERRSVPEPVSQEIKTNG